MVKSSKEKMEEDEKKVISQLQKDSRASINDIAEKCGFSRQRVWRIIKKLEKDKTIWGYSAVTDDQKLNLKRYIMLIKSTPKPVSPLVRNIINLSLQKLAKEIGVDIEGGGYVNGKYDWTLIFTTKDNKQAKKFQELFINNYGQIVSEVDILEYIFPIKKYGVVNPEIKKLEELF
jgi:DNA-binding Lrp family transcriptional regulator